MHVRSGGHFMLLLFEQQRWSVSERGLTLATHLKTDTDLDN
jgi:hypothetical protein